MADAPLPVCGIVMPISAIDNCTEAHWSEVRNIVTEAIEDAGFEANLVSDADDVGIIQKRIIQNLYDNPIVVCDVSGKNPNVMFELGIRLAFDKPTIIIKDDATSYSFDTSAIEHIEYPRDLRFSKIVEFKARLSEKICATHKKAAEDSNYTTFLKHFGEFKVAKIEKKEVSGQEFILEELKIIKSLIRRNPSRNIEYISERTNKRHPHRNSDGNLDFCCNGASSDTIDSIRSRLNLDPLILSTDVEEYSPTHMHLLVKTRASSSDRDSKIKNIVMSHLIADQDFKAAENLGHEQLIAQFRAES